MNIKKNLIFSLILSMGFALSAPTHARNQPNVIESGLVGGLEGTAMGLVGTIGGDLVGQYFIGKKAGKLGTFFFRLAGNATSRFIIAPTWYIIYNLINNPNAKNVFSKKYRKRNVPFHAVSFATQIEVARKTTNIAPFIFQTAKSIKEELVTIKDSVKSIFSKIFKRNKQTKNISVETETFADETLTTDISSEDSDEIDQGQENAPEKNTELTNDNDDEIQEINPTNTVEVEVPEKTKTVKKSYGDYLKEDIKNKKIKGFNFLVKCLVSLTPRVFR